MHEHVFQDDLARIKVLLFGASYKFGLTYHLVQLALSLNQVGLDVVVVAYHGEQVAGLRKKLEEAGIRVLEDDRLGGHGIRNVLRGALILRNYVQQIKPDIIHVQGFHELIMAYLATMRQGAVLYFTTNSVLRNRYALFQRILLNHFADRILCQTELIKQQLMSRGVKAHKIQVIPLGIDVDSFPLSTRRERKERPFKVVYLARFVKGKQHRVALEAFYQLCARGLDVRLVFVGGGPEEGKIREWISELGLTGRVEITSWIPRTEVPNILKDADLAVVTSEWETFGYAIVEPLAAGVPTVSTNVGVAKEILERYDCGKVVPVGDASAVAEAMAELLIDDEARMEMGRRGRLVVERDLAWSAIARKYLADYRQALRERQNLL